MVGAISLYNYYDYPSTPVAHRKLDLPVAENVAIYANLTYVTGVPSQDGMPLDRLRMIDSMISLYNSSKPALEPKLTRQEVGAADPDVALTKLAEKIHALQAAEPKPYHPAVSAQGLMLNTHA